MIKDDDKIPTQLSGKEVTVAEIKNSKRIFKSATPKYTVDWYLKWVSSILILIAMSTRGTGLELYPNISVDLVFSILGTTGWFIVGLIWKDRAVITVNAMGTLLLLRTLVEIIALS